MASRKKGEARNELPEVIPVFPLSGALLLPRGHMPLNIFEPRYLALVDAALASDRIIGMIQPQEEDASGDLQPPLRSVGCAGRITSFAETDDGRYLITLTGLVRFHVVDEVASDQPFRLCRVTGEPFAGDYSVNGEADVDRRALLDAFRAYLEAHELEADWDSVNDASNESLVNAIAMIAPYGPAEKQALLEAPDLKTRAETLVALTEISLSQDGYGPRLQ